jgi:hypothetical protein
MKDLEKLADEVARVIGYPFKTKYGGGGLWILPGMDEVEMGRSYLERVRYAMSLDDPLRELRKLWKYKDLLKPIEHIQYSAYVYRKDLGERPFKCLRIETPHLLFDSRFRGIFSIIRDEEIELERKWDKGFSYDKISNEELEKKAPVTAKVIETCIKLAEEIRRKTGDEIEFFMNREIVEERPWISYPITPIFRFESECFPCQPSRIFDEAISRVKAIKQVWTEWVEARNRICQEIGIDERMLAARDIVEAEFYLPIWSVEARPGGKGGEVIVDPLYLFCWKSTCARKMSKPPFAEGNDDLIFQIEFDKARSVISVYSPPVLLNACIEQAISKDTNIPVNELFRRGFSTDALIDLFKRPEELKANLLDYFTDRKNLEEVARASPTLAKKLEGLIEFLESARGVRDEEIENIVLHNVLYLRESGIYRLSPEESACRGSIGENLSHVRVDLDEKAEFAVRMDFKDPGDTNVIKRFPMWLRRSLEDYLKIKRILWNS